MSIDFSRRDFIKNTGLLAGGAGILSGLPASILKAASINPAKGSTYKDAEHIVLLMQENRSFDHCYGALRGVRGFNDRNILRLPNGNPVWLQTDERGRSYLPFRLDMQNTKITWMGGLPHAWKDQVDARNGGLYDKWLLAKKTGYKGFEGEPMTLGFYNREDLPFNYAFADAFTVCDQHFCSSLTGTTPNRLYFWSGALRKDGLAKHPALVRNSEADYSAEVDWKTLPELLQENSISWKVYQNELSLPSGLNDEEEPWLSNFTDNDLEWFSQFRVRRSKKYEAYVIGKIKEYEDAIADLEERADKSPDDEQIKKVLNRSRSQRKHYKQELERCQKELAAQLSAFDQQLHDNAFCINDFDPDYHSTEIIEYDDHGTKRKMRAPKSDILANFRRDVKEGKLPAVSWLVAPQYFSDHPSAPWFGAWYVSEVLNILTHNEEVWKKTIFILTYDENDGYFDHVPPFIAPDFRKSETGAVSNSIKNIAKEFVTMDDEINQKGITPQNAREHAIGLGYRVPFVVASPWSRGGFVNSQIFDHTSCVQFIEDFASRKTGKKLRLDNVSEWRRAVCGDLSSVFRPYNGEKIAQPEYLKRNAFLRRIDEAKYQPIPKESVPLTDAEIEKLKTDFALTKGYFSQEEGIKPSSWLPYELYADGNVKNGKMEFVFEAGKLLFGDRAYGSPFSVYSYLPYGNTQSPGHNWSFGVAAGEKLQYDIPLSLYNNNRYHFALFGPNGFFRELKGEIIDSDLNINCKYGTDLAKGKRNIVLVISNTTGGEKHIVIKDNVYGQKDVIRRIPAKGKISVSLNTEKNKGWYDLSIHDKGNSTFLRKYAGRVENGRDSITDPAMG
ncbi:MAG TPA: phospholipase C, phosphocholine-specific [Niabella sp.]|nr:phospholipase C, phosphocholine-specific [Niabella sp.]